MAIGAGFVAVTFLNTENPKFKLYFKVIQESDIQVSMKNCLELLS